MINFKNSDEGLTQQLLQLPCVESLIVLTCSGLSKDKIMELKNNIFTIEELKYITKITLYLKKHGRSTYQTTVKKNLSICMFELRSTYGDTRW